MKILIVVDMQNDFITGSLGTPEARDIVPNVKAKIDKAVENGDIIVYTRDTHFTNYLDSKEGQKLPVEHCIMNTDGWKIVDELLPKGGYERYFVYDKFTFGDVELPLKVIEYASAIGFKSSNIDEIELVGLCTDICVVSNALIFKAAFYSMFDISVDATCCAGVTPESHEAALKTMEMCQIDVKRG
jgi:nicotinamidase-related amidase